MSRKILFVDDDPAVLGSLGRVLHPMRYVWDMTFVQSGKEALALMSTKPFDVIVTDILMPEMDGIELLRQVMERYPRMVRIVLSGLSEREIVLKSVGYAHQHLVKPCDVELLKKMVSRACAMRDALASGAMAKMVARITKLPSFPALYFAVIEEMKSPNCSVDRIGAIVSRDVSMSAKILQIANSAYFGMSRKVTSPARAVSLVGLDVLKALILSAHIFSVFGRDVQMVLRIDTLWEHSLGAAAIAREIAALESREKEAVSEAFIAGLLHDIGQVVLASNMPEDYKGVMELAKAENITAEEAERASFDVTHAEIGGYLLALWGLPDSIVEAVFFHHAPRKCIDNSGCPVIAVHAADVISARRLSDDWAGALPVMDTGYIEELGLAERIPIWESLGLVEKA